MNIAIKKVRDFMRIPNSLKYIPILAAILTMVSFQTVQNLPAQNSTTTGQSTTTTAVKVPIRIAYVNIQQVIATCDEGKNAGDSWQQWAEKKRAELQSMQKELEDLQKQLEVQGAKLIEEARYALEDTIETKSTMFQRAQQDMQKEADTRQRRLTNTIYQKVLPVIERIADEKNLDLVHFFDINRDAYIRSSLFITDEVIEAYNRAYPVTDTGQSIKQ